MTSTGSRRTPSTCRLTASTRWHMSHSTRCTSTSSASRGCSSGSTPAGKSRTSNLPADQITVYTKSWCRDCHIARRVLKQHQIAYVEVDVEHDEAALVKVLELNRGMASVPTILFPSGR